MVLEPLPIVFTSLLFGWGAVETSSLSVVLAGRSSVPSQVNIKTASRCGAVVKFSREDTFLRRTIYLSTLTMVFFSVSLEASDQFLHWVNRNLDFIYFSDMHIGNYMYVFLA